MNKNDIIKIARQLYLQESISRQLFAKFDIYKQLNQFDGSFAPSFTKLYDLFCVFVGSHKNKTTPQIIKKDGLSFTVYGLGINGQINERYTKTINGFDNLANYFDINSSQIVATGTSFHGMLRRIVQQITIDNLIGQYSPPASEQEEKYSQLNQKYDTNSEQLTNRLWDWKIRYIINKWTQDVINTFDVIINDVNNIDVLNISNNKDNIVTQLVGLRQQITSRISQYLRANKQKLLNKVSLNEKVVNVIQQYIKQNSVVQSLLTTANQTNQIKETTGKFFERVTTNIKYLQKFISKLQRIQQIPFAKQLLDVITKSNNSHQLLNNVNGNSVLDFNCKKDNIVTKLNQQIIQYNDTHDEQPIEQYDYNKPLDNNVEDNKNKGNKQDVNKLVKFIKNLGDGLLRFTTWDVIYQLLKQRFYDNQEVNNLLNQFNSLINKLSGQKIKIIHCRLKYLQGYKAIQLQKEGKKLSKSGTQKKQEAEHAYAQLVTLFSDISDGAIIVDNIINKSVDLFTNKYHYNTNKIKSISENAESTLHYCWILGTDLLTKMKRLVDAIEQ